MRAVLDSNVIISATLFNGVPEQVVLIILGGNHTLVLSPFIIEETERILRDKFQQESEQFALLERLLSHAAIQYFQPFLHELSDEPDNRVLETAVKGRADCIITGDKQLLKLKSYKGIKIIKPADLLAISLK